MSGWQEFVQPGLDDAVLWPFDGALQELLHANNVVLIETHPCNKRKKDDRSRVSSALMDRIAQRGAPVQDMTAAQVGAGFTPGSDNDDRFDALVGLLATLNVNLGPPPEGPPPDAGVVR